MDATAPPDYNEIGGPICLFALCATEDSQVPSSHEITRLLKEGSQGGREAADELMPLVYDELRRLARDYLRRERPDHTLQPTALVHEAYLRLVDQRNVDWQGRTHFFAVAARMMPRVLIDHARRKLSAKRGRDRRRVSLEGLFTRQDDREREVDLLDLGEALRKLNEQSERQARIVELRFFGGLSVEETAHELGISSKTVKRDWRFARAWLRNQLKASGY